MIVLFAEIVEIAFWSGVIWAILMACLLTWQVRVSAKRIADLRLVVAKQKLVEARRRKASIRRWGASLRLAAMPTRKLPARRRRINRRASRQ